MDEREPIGFALKGFRNFYSRKYTQKPQAPEFRNLVCLIEEIVEEIGNDIFSEDKRKAYRKAIEIAKDDQVQLTEIPRQTHA
jgi:hypothetical protein